MQDDGDDGVMDTTLPLATDGSTRDTTTAALKSFGANITTEPNRPAQRDEDEPAGSGGSAIASQLRCRRLPAHLRLFALVEPPGGQG